MAWRSDPSNLLAAQANDAGAGEAARDLVETLFARAPGAAPGPSAILAVAAGAVRLAWRGAPACAPECFEPRPQQSCPAARGAIVEGMVRKCRTPQAGRSVRA